jgi:hypothetical protein
MVTDMKEFIASHTRESVLKMKGVLKVAKKYKNELMGLFVHEVLAKRRYNLDKEMNVNYEDENLIFRTTDAELVKSVPATHVVVVRKQDNPHQLLHTERVHLMEYGIKKYFGVNDINGIDPKKRLIMVSPCAGLYLKIFFTHNILINQAITEDPNDIQRLMKLIFNLLRLAPDEDSIAKIFTNICTCVLDEHRCEHMKKEKGNGLYIFAHSIYYMKDKLINEILKNGEDILFTAHILKNNSKGKVSQYLFNEVEGRITEKERLKFGTNNEVTEFRVMNKKIIKQRNPGVEYEMASWKCENNWVEFLVTDDKLYEHPNFCPRLYKVKNITTKTTVTKVDKWFIHENMIHVVGTIIGVGGMENDFTSNDWIPEYKDNYIIQPGSKISRINPNILGSIYMSYDKESDRNALMRVYESTTEIITFRVGQFSMWERLKWKIGSLFTEKEYMDFTRAVKLEKKGNKLVISNEAMNALLESLLNIDRINGQVLQSMWKRCLATFGTSAVDQTQIYDIMTILLFEAVKTRALIYELESSDMVKCYNEMIRKENYSWYTRVIDYLFSSRTDMKKTVKVGPIEEKREEKREQKKMTYNPVERLQKKKEYVKKMAKKNLEIMKMVMKRDTVIEEMLNYEQVGRSYRRRKNMLRKWLKRT